MREKIKDYLDSLFAQVPATPEVVDARAELYDGMLQRFDDCVGDGMDEQEAYDNVIDSIGDIRELFDELNAAAPEGYAPGHDGYGPGTGQGGGTKERPEGAGGFGFDFGAFVRNVTDTVTDFTSGIVSGLFDGYESDLRLVNTCTLPLDGIIKLDVSYVAENITLLPAEDGQFTVLEYMNREDPVLYADITLQHNSISVKNGRRSGMFGLRSRIEVLVPPSFAGSIAISTVSGSIVSKAPWKVTSFTAKAVSGSVTLEDVEAGKLRATSTSSDVRIERAVGDMDLRSVSGSVRVQRAEGSGVFKSTSGGVRVHFEQLMGNVEATSVSGGVRLGIPEGTGFEFDAKSVSGRIFTDFDECLTFQKRNKAHGFVGNAPYYVVRASSTSGSIHVND